MFDHPRNITDTPPNNHQHITNKLPTHHQTNHLNITKTSLTNVNITKTLPKHQYHVTGTSLSRHENITITSLTNH